MITPGNIYPGLLFLHFFPSIFSLKQSKLVTESPYLEGPDKIENPKGFLGKSNKFGYQSHYTLGSFLFLFSLNNLKLTYNYKNSGQKQI